MTPVEGALLAAGVTTVGEIAIAASIISWRYGRGRFVSRDKVLLRRMRRAAAPLTGSASAGMVAGLEESIFRSSENRSALSWLWRAIESRYPLLDARRAVPLAAGASVAAAILCWFSIWFLKVPAGGLTLPLAGLAGMGGIWHAMRWQQERQELEFIRLFPEIVDQIVRLAGAGVPSLEAVSAVAADASPPVQPVLRSLCDALLAGVDADTALRMASDRLRLAEFTMFAAVLRLQRRSGGGISAAFANLAQTLRERRASALKIRASTAQSRLTLFVLAMMPVAVLVAQKFITPASVDMLFGTEDGTFLLQVGVGLVVAGLLVARGLIAWSTW